ncbi:MAG: FtsX-like permease family protein, partial [Candidatus Limnocylindrales bacterium]
IATIGGAALGVLLFFVTRPLVAMVPLDGAGWFPGAIQPPLAQAAIMLGLIPVVGAAAALVALRRVVVTPLGVQRRQTPPKPGPARALPLIGALLLLVVAMALTRGRGAETTLLLLGGAFGGVLVGIFLVGPWLTASIGTILGRLPGGASTLLAARRLSDDPRGSFGSIAGVIMAVFVAAAFFTFTGYAATLEFDRAGAIHPDQVFAELPFGEGPTLADLPAQLAAMPGTRAVVSIAAGELFVEGSPVIAWVADCPTLVTQFELPSSACDGALAHAVNGGTDWLIGTSSFTSDRGDRMPIDLEIRRRDASTFEVGDSPSANQLPDVILDPSLFATAARQPALSRLYVTTDGSSAAAERVRTAIDVAAPAAFVRLTEESRSSNSVYAEFGRVVALGLAGSLVLAGCSLAVAVTTGILDRRRQFALLRSAGMPVSRLRALVLLQAGVPLITIALFSAALGVAVAQIVLRLASDVAVPLPDPSLLAILVVSLLGAMAIVAGTLPSLERLTRPEGLRVE